MKSAHTSGPWSLGHPQSQVWGSKNRILIAEVLTHEDDAHLIAAAPELLDALREVYDELVGLAAYFETCASEIILENLPNTITSLRRKKAMIAAAILKARADR
jgi:hypothetical protein